MARVALGLVFAAHAVTLRDKRNTEPAFANPCAPV